MNKQYTSRRRSARRGFTLIEAIVVIVIIGVLAGMIVPRLIGRVGSSKQAVAASNAAALASALKLYHADYGALPESLDALAVKPSDPNGHGPYIDNPDQLKDPWGRPFRLVLPPQAKNADFDVVSYGADGQPGGDGENADIIKP
jgi:general secretion pathway protein G